MPRIFGNMNRTCSPRWRKTRQSDRTAPQETTGRRILRTIALGFAGPVDEAGVRKPSAQIKARKVVLICRREEEN